MKHLGVLSSVRTATCSLYFFLSFMLLCRFTGADTQTKSSEAVTGNPPATPEATRGSQQSPTPVEAAVKAEEKVEEPQATTLTLGGNLYYGRSNLEGFKKLRDGFWAAGSGLAYPSVLELRLATRNHSEAKISFGVGHLYTNNTSTLDQPHEAWYRTPKGGVNITAGKFYVPFALQEWQYETKWGVMIEGKRGAYTWAASANYNQNLNTPNGYLRVGRNFGEKLNVGVSLAAGKGLSYDSIFDRAAAIDVTASWQGWNLYGEGLTMQRRSSERFNFGWVKLEYDKLGKFKPFIARYQWRDTTDNFGSFHSNSIGASYALLPQLAIEGGLAQTPDKNVQYIQFHWTPEYKIWTKGERGARSGAGASPASGLPPQLLPHRQP